MIDELNISIWERSFVLPVEYDCYEDETVTNAQEKAVKALLLHSEWIANAKLHVETFCKEQVLADDANQKKDNIFSYIKPEFIFVKRADRPKIALMCKYRYDIEHGLAIVFAPDGSITVGPQDIIL